MIDEAVFADVRTVLQPLRAGSVFQAFPAAQVWVPGGRLNDIRAALPTETETAVEYVDRMASQGHDRFALRVIEPWATHWPRWKGLRDAVEDTWRVSGIPVVPCDSELVMCHGTQPYVQRADDHIAHTWDLSPEACAGGVLGRPDRAGPGVPISSPSEDRCARLSVFEGTDSRRVVARTAHVTASRMDSGAKTDDTPYSPMGSGSQPVPHLVDVADQLRAAVTDQGAERRTRLQWLRHVSACALQTPPPARDRSEIRTDHTEWERCSPVLHSTFGDELLCAANGHVFSIRDTRASSVLALLNKRSKFTLRWLTEELPLSSATALVVRLAQTRAIQEAS